jgi:hypothetical protein
MDPMMATIRQIDTGRHMVFGFAAGLPDEADWYTGLLQTCPSGGSCEVTDGALVEFGYLDRLKKMAIGMREDALPDGVWVGVEVHREPVWKKVLDGSVKRFTVAVTPEGVAVEFDHSAVTKGETNMPISEDGRFILSKSCPELGLIQKCRRASQTGNYEGLTKQCFEKALDAIAREYASEANLNFYQATDAVLKTQFGSQLYAGYLSAPVDTTLDKRADPVDPAWDRIIKAARQFKDDSKVAMSEAQAVSEILKREPELYDRYIESRDNR